MLKAAVHENVPGYKHLVVRDLADALGGSTAAEDTSKSLALKNLEQTDPGLGERDTQEELNQQAALDIQENAEAFVQGGFQQPVNPPSHKFRMHQCAPGLLPVSDWPSHLPSFANNGEYDDEKYDRWYGIAPGVIDWLKSLPDIHLKFGRLVGNNSEQIRMLVDDNLRLSGKEVVTASAASATPPSKRQKTARITSRQRLPKPEDDQLYKELKSLLGGSDQRVFLWHDTSQKWFKPWGPFKGTRQYDEVASAKLNAATDDYVKAFCKQYTLMPKKKIAVLFYRTRHEKPDSGSSKKPASKKGKRGLKITVKDNKRSFEEAIEGKDDYLQAAIRLSSYVAHGKKTGADKT